MDLSHVRVDHDRRIGQAGYYYRPGSSVLEAEAVEGLRRGFERQLLGYLIFVAIALNTSAVVECAWASPQTRKPAHPCY